MNFINYNFTRFNFRFLFFNLFSLMGVESAKPQDQVWQKVFKQLRRYKLTIIIPSICFGIIYLDWSHTQKLKREKELQNSK